MNKESLGNDLNRLVLFSNGLLITVTINHVKKSIILMINDGYIHRDKMKHIKANRDNAKSIADKNDCNYTIELE